MGTAGSPLESVPWRLQSFVVMETALVVLWFFGLSEDDIVAFLGSVAFPANAGVVADTGVGLFESLGFLLSNIKKFRGLGKSVWKIMQKCETLFGQKIHPV